MVIITCGNSGNKTKGSSFQEQSMVFKKKIFLIKTILSIIT